MNKKNEIQRWIAFFVLSGNKERKENLVSVKHERWYDTLEMNSHSEIAHKKIVPSTIIFRCFRYKGIKTCVFGVPTME